VKDNLSPEQALRLNELFEQMLVSKEWENTNFRKFLFDNIGFLKIWWSGLDKQNRSAFKLMVKKGMIELPNCAISMSDALLPHAAEVLDNFAFGNKFCTEELDGYSPKSAYFVDMFGFSRSFANVIL
jgi:hypothetical protein